MASDSKFVWREDWRAYYVRHRLSNGQYCMIAFSKFDSGRSIFYYVAFAVADKKKVLNGWFVGDKHNNIELKMTGKCGIEALIWARNTLIAFEDFVDIDKTLATKIIVQGSDPKRFRMYEKVLSKYGYEKSFQFGSWSMVKTLRKG